MWEYLCWHWLQASLKTPWTFFFLVLFRFPSKLHFELYVTKKKKTKAWILLLVTVFWSGPIFVRSPFPGTVKISASLPKNHPVLFQDCAHWPCPVLLQKCSSWEFHFASSPGFVNTVICCHVNNIQVYLLYVNGCRNGWLFSHPDFFLLFQITAFPMKMTFWCSVFVFHHGLFLKFLLVLCLSCQSNLLNKIHFSTYVLLSWYVCFFWIIWFIVNREVPFYAWKTWFYCLWKFTVNFFEVQIETWVLYHLDQNLMINKTRGPRVT